MCCYCGYYHCTAVVVLRCKVRQSVSISHLGACVLWSEWCCNALLKGLPCTMSKASSLLASEIPPQGECLKQILSYSVINKAAIDVHMASLLCPRCVHAALPCQTCRPYRIRAYLHEPHHSAPTIHHHHHHHHMQYSHKLRCHIYQRITNADQ